MILLNIGEYGWGLTNRLSIGLSHMHCVKHIFTVTEHEIASQESNYLHQQGGGYVIVLSVYLSVYYSVSRITEKVISRFHWNLVLWSGLPIGRTD